MKTIESEETTMMDKFERRELERMYRDGYGPTAIADELGISINTIKSYIRRHPSMKKRYALSVLRKDLFSDEGPQGQEVLLRPMPQRILELQVSQGRQR